MALSNEELQDIISNLSPEERKQLLSQLGRQVEVDSITNPTNATGEKTKPKVQPRTLFNQTATKRYTNHRFGFWIVRKVRGSATAISCK